MLRNKFSMGASRQFKLNNPFSYFLGIVSVDGHFPSSTDENFAKFLTIGPLTRYAEDLEPMLFALAGKNTAHGIDRDEIINLKDLKVPSKQINKHTAIEFSFWWYDIIKIKINLFWLFQVTYMLEAGNTLALPSTQESIKAAMLNATRYLKRELDADVQPVNYQKILSLNKLIFSVILPIF